VADPSRIRVPLRLAPSTRPWRRATATWVPPDQLPLLRRLAYSLPHLTIARSEIALTTRGAIVRCADGVDGIPLGLFFVEAYPQLYLPAGHEVSPAVGADVLSRSVGGAPSQLVFVLHDQRAVGLDRAAFGPLEAALLEAPPWEPVAADAIASALDETPIELEVTSIGILPLRGVQPPPAR
jgi:hypothetical protein